MAMDESISPWEAMEIEANETSETPGPRRPMVHLTFALIRTLVLVVLAALAILVLLPAIAAQAASVA